MRNVITVTVDSDDTMTTMMLLNNLNKIVDTTSIYYPNAVITTTLTAED